MPDARSVLERARSNFPAPEMPLEGVLRRRDRRRRNQRLAAGVLGIAVVLIAAAGGVSLLRSDSRPADQPDPGLAPILREGEVLQPVGQFGPDARLDAVDPATGSSRTLFGCADPCDVIYRYALSPDGRWLAYEVGWWEGEGIWVTNAAGDQRQLMSTDVAGGDASWKWSAHGATLLATDGHEVFAVDPFDASRTPLGTGRSVSALAGSTDGSLVAFSDRSSVWTVPSDGGGVSTLVFDHDGSVGAIDWSPDGTRLAVDISGPSFNSITVVDLAAGTPTTIAEGSFPRRWTPSPALPVWSPDGSRIAYVTAQSGRDDFVLELWVVNPDGSSPVRVFRDQELVPCCPYGSSGPVWSPDGSQIAFEASDLGRWFVVPSDGSGPAEPFSAGEAEAWRIS